MGTYNGLEVRIVGPRHAPFYSPAKVKTMASGIFIGLTEDQMVAWENKPAATQTWQALQDYFTEKWLERRQYSQATVKHS